MKKLKTPLARSLQRAFAKALLLEKHPNRYPTPDDLDEHLYNASRRRFLGNTLKAGAALYLGGALYGCMPTPPGSKPKAQADKGPKIAIVGGGIAGLNAAYLLQKGGYNPQVYEAGSRTGGRIFSVTGLLADGIYTELGGEYIDSDHVDMMSLVKEFGLELLDTAAPSESGLIAEAFHLNGRFYTEKDLLAAFRPMALQIEKDAASISDTIGYAASTPEERAFDNTSAEEYIARFKAPKWFNKLLEVAYTSEMGIHTGKLSAITFFTFIGTGADKFQIFGDSDERYKTKGGNQQIVDKLADAVRERIHTGHALEALLPAGNGYRLKFENGKEADADVVVLALPFTKLRSVDIQVPLPEHKKKAINELSYGTNSKLMLAYKERVWRNEGYGGYLFNEVLQNGWDNSRMQGGNKGPGGYTLFLGGDAGLNLTNGATQPYIDMMHKVYKGSKAAYGGKYEIFNWPKNPLTLGSYASYTVGQWTGIGGAEAEPVGNIFFAGEHCSVDYQGYMNGGAETGRLAAEAVMAKVKK